jgi:Ca2+-transporting ATPase
VLLARLELPQEERRSAEEALRAMTARGLRVLAVGQRLRPSRPVDAADAESGLALVGLVALHDPPRASAARAIAACRRAGLVTVMITGDHPQTAAAIARELGILEPDDLVVTGWDVLAGLGELDLSRVRVYDRTAPEQKLAIVQALQQAGHIVAMTGDGVNDAPALRIADVGVAMGRSGTEVARQAADIVLVEDDFSGIVAAVEEGRPVYDNIRRFLLYALSGGAAEVLLMLGGPFVGLALPLLPAQILWVNMLTHGLPGVALGAEQAEPDTLRRPPRDPEQGVLGDGLMVRVLGLGTLVALVSLGLGVWAQATGREWQSMVFVTLTLSQLGVALVLRSENRSLLRGGLRGNPFLLLSVALNVFLLWLALAWGPLAGILDQRSR